MGAPVDRRLRNRILATIRRDGGRTPEELAAMSGLPEREIASACWAMYQMRILDNVQGQFVLSTAPPAPVAAPKPVKAPTGRAA